MSKTYYRYGAIFAVVVLAFTGGIWWFSDNWILLRGMWLSIQRDLIDLLVHALEDNEAQRYQSMMSQVAIIFGVFLYGFVHSLGPGHGKSVILIAIQETAPSSLRVVALALFISVMQGITTWLVVSVVQWILGIGFKDTIAIVGELNQWVGAAMCAIGTLGLLQYILSLFPHLVRRSNTASLNSLGQGQRMTSSFGVMLVVAFRPCLSTSLIFLYTALWFNQTTATMLLTASFVGSFASLLTVSLVGYGVHQRFSGFDCERKQSILASRYRKAMKSLIISTFYLLIGWGLFTSGKVTMSPIL